MITYSQLTKKTMPPEKRAKASRCIVGHYLVRPISNIVSIPLIERKVNPTNVTIASAVFPIIAFISFLVFHGTAGFAIGWLSILIWNILDGVDGNIARYNNQCSKFGELWDAAAGWLAIMAFYFGMGFVSFYNPGFLFDLNIPSYLFLILGSVTAMCWIYPRLVMQKKVVLMGDDSVKEVQDRTNYGLLKLLFFNMTSINGGAAIIFLFAYVLKLNALCMCGYFLLSVAVAVGSLFSLLFKNRE